jgi:general secretion pathway protein D
VITTQELTEIVQLVRQVSNVEKIGWDTNNDQIVMRDRISRVALAQGLLEQLFSYHPEVMIDLELLQVSDSDIANYGFTVTNNFPLVFLGNVLGSAQSSVASIPSGVTNLLTFGAGRTLIGIAAAQVQAMFNETFSHSKALYSARLRSGSNQVGVFHVGEKYPIITSGFVGVSASSSNLAYAAPPAVSFEDLGLEVKATPHVHGADSVSMTIEATYETLTGQSADGIPVIQSNKITTDIRVRNEEWAVVAGLIDETNNKTVSGFAGLASIPWIGNLFRQTSTDKETTHFLIGIRPHILYMGPDENVTAPLRAGTDARPFTPL